MYNLEQLSYSGLTVERKIRIMIVNELITMVFR